MGGSAIRATVSPPTATQRCVVGQDRPVRASGAYSVADALKSAPPSLLWATAPVPTAGVPTQFVPTMTQIDADGQAIPKISSMGWVAAERTQVCPPSSLVRSAPCAGTTALSVVDVVPTARQELMVAHTAPCNSPVPAGTTAAAHVPPPSVLMAMAPCPWPAVVAVYPVTRQAAPGRHERSPASKNPAGRSPSRVHVCPKSVEWADQKVEPSLAMAVQSLAPAQTTLVTTMAPVGTEAWAQVAPPSPVVTTTPAVPEALSPTAMQSSVVGHETAVRAGAGVRVSDWADQVFPPSTVASMTVADDGGTEEVVALAPAGPGAPTAQQWVGPAQVTASSWGVPTGAG